MSYCCKSNFWMGLGLGAVLGAVCYRYSRTQHAKELKCKVQDAVRKVSERGSEMLNSAKEKMADNGNNPSDKTREFNGANK